MKELDNFVEISEDILRKLLEDYKKKEKNKKDNNKNDNNEKTNE